MGNVVVVKLTSGEELIGKEFSVDDPNYYGLEDPAIVFVEGADDGNFQIGIVPFMIFTEDAKFPILITACSVPPKKASDAMTEKYNSIFGAGIIVPDNNVVVPLREG